MPLDLPVDVEQLLALADAAPPEVPRIVGRISAAAGGDAPAAGDPAPQHTVWVYQGIGEWRGVSARVLAREVAALDPRAHLTVRINSPGGSVFDALAILGALQDHPGPVTAITDGLAASAASVILQGGKDRLMRSGTRVMIHNARGLAWGSSAELRKTADIIDSISAGVADIYAQRSGRPAAEHQAAMDAETWYSATEAIKAGLADRLLTPPAPRPASNRDQAVRARARARGRTA